MTPMWIGGIALLVEPCDGVMLLGITGFALDGGGGIGDNRRHRRGRSAANRRRRNPGGVWPAGNRPAAVASQTAVCCGVRALAGLAVSARHLRGLAVGGMGFAGWLGVGG